jgi:hypothetical protein
MQKHIILILESLYLKMKNRLVYLPNLDSGNGFARDGWVGFHVRGTLKVQIGPLYPPCNSNRHVKTAELCMLYIAELPDCGKVAPREFVLSVSISGVHH